MEKKAMKKPIKSIVLTCLSVVGLFGTTALAVRSGMKTKESLNNNPDATTPKEIISIVWKHYIATIVSLVATGTCIVLSHTLDAKQIAALGGVAAAGATTFSKYRSKVREVIGPEDEKKIFNAVRANTNETIHPSLADFSDMPLDTIFLDGISGVYFQSNIARVEHAIYHLNRNLVCRGFVSANEWFDFIGIDRDPGFDDSQWYVDFFFNIDLYPWIDVVITDKVRKSDGIPYKMIEFDFKPLSPEELKIEDELLYDDLFG